MDYPMKMKFPDFSQISNKGPSCPLKIMIKWEKVFINTYLWAFLVFQSFLGKVRQERNSSLHKSQKTVSTCNSWTNEGTIVFHMSKKSPWCVDYVVKRICHYVNIWQRYSPRKLGQELWDTLYKWQWLVKMRPWHEVLWTSGLTATQHHCMI